MMKTYNILFLSIIAFLSVSAAWSEGRGDEFSIGLMAALSGDFATLGNDCRRGYELAQGRFAPNNEAYGQHLRFIYADTRGTGGPATSEFQRLVNYEHVGAVINHRSQAVMPLNPLSARMKIPLLGILGQSEFIVTNPYAFRFWPATSVEAGALVQAIVKLGFKRAAIVSVEDEYTLSLKKHFIDQFKNVGGTIVFDKDINPEEQSFSSLIVNMGQSNPDVIFANLAVTQLGTFVRQSRNLQLHQQFVGSLWVVVKEFIEAAGAEAAEGLIFAQVNTRQPKFYELLGDPKMETSVSPGVYTCFSALSGLLQALRSCSPRCDVLGAYEGLKRLSYIELPDERLPVRDREVIFDMALKTYHQGKITDYNWSR